MKAIGYARVSTEQQKISGSGINAQADAIEGFYKYRLQSQMRLVKICKDEGVSGTIAFRERPGGIEAVSLLEPGDHLIIAKLDRAFRSMHDMVVTMRYLASIGVIVHFLDFNISTDSYTGRMLLNIMAALAEFERERIAERVRESIESRKKRMLPIGRPKIGWKIVAKGGRKRLAPNEHERALAEYCVTFYEQGFTNEQIAKALADQGVTTRSGTPVDCNLVSKLKRLGYKVRRGEGSVY